MKKYDVRIDDGCGADVLGIIFDEEGFVTSCANVPYPLS